jgi:hypothetical protein
MSQSLSVFIGYRRAELWGKGRFAAMGRYSTTCRGRLDVVLRRIGENIPSVA